MKHFEAFETKTHFYLELAMREEIPLLTLDKGLIKAAKKNECSSKAILH